MSEIPYAGNPGQMPEQQPPFADQMPDQQLPAGHQSAEQYTFDQQPSSEGGFGAREADLDGQAPSEIPAQAPGETPGEATDRQTVTYREWLERQGIDSTSVPHREMDRRAFDVFRNAPAGYLPYVKERYGIPQDDQANNQYAVVNIKSDEPGKPSTPKLTMVDDAEFGTVVDVEFEPTPADSPTSEAPAETERTAEHAQGEEAAAEMKAAYEAWLERRGIDPDPATTPHLTMDRPAFDVFRNAPQEYLPYVRRCYGIPAEDQLNCQYVLVDVKPDDPDTPPTPKLTIVNDVEFGTTIDREVVDMDFEQPDPDAPTPERPHGAYKTFDIGATLVESAQRLQTFTELAMEGQTTDPFSTEYGDVAVRAGSLMEGQKDAYVWTTNPITRSVELTVAFPWQYDSVCIVRGQQREAANGKVGMAQIVNPEEVLKIEGENLRRLKEVYTKLYKHPDYALTDRQREERDELFNDSVKRMITNQARINHEQAEQRRRDEEYRRYQQPQYRQRPLPR